LATTFERGVEIKQRELAVRLDAIEQVQTQRRHRADVVEVTM
tara:strand:+ start:292 stop:417 length:126 start_codon:yes stop_codon:yes gene_type:complete